MAIECISTQELFTVVSTGKNKEGRTPFVKFFQHGKKIFKQHGVFLDSDKDVKAIELMNDEMRKAKREYLVKEKRSEESASRAIITC